jgi:hypothetical protein
VLLLEVLKDPKFKHKLIIVHPHVKEIATKFDGKQGSIIYIKAKLGENETVPKILEAVILLKFVRCYDILPLPFLFAVGLSNWVPDCFQCDRFDCIFIKVSVHINLFYQIILP